MTRVLFLLITFLVLREPLAAQSEAVSNVDLSAGAQNKSQEQPDKKEMERVVFNDGNKLPDSPKPKIQHTDENSVCPRGEGSPCALLGGWLYFKDHMHLDEHQDTWLDAFTTEGMLESSGALFASTALDMEGTQHCLKHNSCEELNPLMKLMKTKGEKYATAMPLNAFAVWAAVRDKQHGHGTRAFMLMWCGAAVHTYFGLGGLSKGPARRPPPSPRGTEVRQ